MLRKHRIGHRIALLAGTFISLVAAGQVPAMAAEPTYVVEQSTSGLYTYAGNGYDRPFDDEADGVVGDDRGYVGPIQLSNGATRVTAYCLDLEHGLAEQYASDAQQIVDDTTERQRVEVAYMIARWGNTNDDVRAAAVQIAIWKIFAPQHFVEGAFNVAPATELTERLYGTIANAEHYAEATGTRLKTFATQMLESAHALAVTHPEVSIDWKDRADGALKFRANVTGADATGAPMVLPVGESTGQASLEGAAFPGGDDQMEITNGRWYTVKQDVGVDGLLEGELLLPYRETIEVLYPKAEGKPKQRLIPFGTVNAQTMSFAEPLVTQPLASPAESDPTPLPTWQPSAAAEPEMVADPKPVSTSSNEDTGSVANTSDTNEPLARTGANQTIASLSAVAIGATILGCVGVLVAKKTVRKRSHDLEV